LKNSEAVMFRRLSQIAAIILVLLVTCPWTAPFASFDFATEAASSPVHETFDGSVKTVIAPVAIPFLLRIEPTGTHHLTHAIFVFSDDDRSPLRSVLRL
jgi:hypothetical protein